MNTIPDELKSLLERDKIRECIVRLARGEDRRNAELISASYWPDSTTDYGVFVGSFDKYLAWVVPGSPAIPVTQHVLGQSAIDLQSSTALVETHVISYHRVNMGKEERDTVIGGRYLDRLDKRAGEWRIAQRTMLYDWFQDFGVSVDWTQGVMDYRSAATTTQVELSATTARFSLARRQGNSHEDERSHPTNRY
jgi:SnoaL-like protein